MKKRNASSKARMELNRLIHKMRKEEKMGGKYGFVEETIRHEKV